MIIAEGSLADGDLSGAQTSMASLIGLVNSRSTSTFSDAVEDREDRPASPSVMVQASAADPLIGGLVLDRQAGNVTIPVISGTSVTDARVNALADVPAALELLYLMRQEVFISEGRRFVDMGIKIPIHENEMLLNPSVEASHLEPFIPSFMPSDLDGFTFDETAGTVTISVNMNKVLVDNRTDPSVVPFF